MLEWRRGSSSSSSSSDSSSSCGCYCDKSAWSRISVRISSSSGSNNSSSRRRRRRSRSSRSSSSSGRRRRRRRNNRSSNGSNNSDKISRAPALVREHTTLDRFYESAIGDINAKYLERQFASTSLFPCFYGWPYSERASRPSMHSFPPPPPPPPPTTLSPLPSRWAGR